MREIPFFASKGARLTAHGRRSRQSGKIICGCAAADGNSKYAIGGKLIKLNALESDRIRDGSSPSARSTRPRCFAFSLPAAWCLCVSDADAEHTTLYSQR